MSNLDIYDDVLEYIEKELELRQIKCVVYDDEEARLRPDIECRILEEVKGFLIELKKPSYCSEIEYCQKKILQAQYLITKLNESQFAQKAVYKWKIDEYETRIKMIMWCRR